MLAHVIMEADKALQAGNPQKPVMCLKPKKWIVDGIDSDLG